MVPRVGESAPNFVLTDHTGRRWDLAAQRGHDVIVIFHRHLM
jgi:peroxiredoxin